VAPGRRTGGHGVVFDRARASRVAADVASPDETEARVVEVVAIEIVDRTPERAGPHELVEYLVLEEKVN
jgi:hypothetical protein